MQIRVDFACAWPFPLAQRSEKCQVLVFTSVWKGFVSPFPSREAFQLAEIPARLALGILRDLMAGDLI